MTLTQQKRVVRRFLEQCNTYAAGKLAEYEDRRRTTEDEDSAPIEAKIAQWTSYRDFNAYALSELETDRLDDWFDASAETD